MERKIAAWIAPLPTPDRRYIPEKQLTQQMQAVASKALHAGLAFVLFGGVRCGRFRNH